MQLGHAFPCTHTLYAVSADADGNPAFHRVHSFGMLQDQQHCVLVGMIADTAHLEAADRLLEHVGYSETTDPAPWAEKCRAKRDELTAIEEAKSKGPQIIVPDRTVKPAYH